MINDFFRMLLGDKFGIVASAFFGFISKGANSRSVTHSKQSVPLIRPEEFVTLEKPILFAFRAPVPLKQAFYYKDDRMMKLIAEKERVLHTV